MDSSVVYMLLSALAITDSDGLDGLDLVPMEKNVLLT